MSRGLSLDLRARVIALVEGGTSRRAAARQMQVAESSAIKWFKRYQQTGSFAEKPGKKAQYSPLEAHSEWLLALAEAEPSRAGPDAGADCPAPCEGPAVPDHRQFGRKIFPAPQDHL